VELQAMAAEWLVATAEMGYLQALVHQGELAPAVLHHRHRLYQSPQMVVAMAVLPARQALQEWAAAAAAVVVVRWQPPEEVQWIAVAVVLFSMLSKEFEEWAQRQT